MTSEQRPHIDEHAVKVAADPDAVWGALLTVVERSFGSARTSRVARLLGCADTENDGPRPLATGSVLPGFHVEEADPPRKLELVGGHRFSNYALVFRIEGDSGSTALRAETRAAFPGLKGNAYKTLVIRTHGHVLVTRRLLGAVKARAERR